MSVRLNSLRPNTHRGAVGVAPAATPPAGAMQLPAAPAVNEVGRASSVARPSTPAAGMVVRPSVPAVFPAGAFTSGRRQHAPAGLYLSTSRRSLAALRRVVTRSTAARSELALAPARTGVAATRLRSGRVLT